MILSRIRSSLTRSSSSKNLLYRGGGGRSAVVSAPGLRDGGVNEYLGRIEGGFGFLRGYRASIGAHKDFRFMPSMSELSSGLANPRFSRFFSSEDPGKKNYENFTPKGKKETPKENEQKSESKGCDNPF